MSLNYLSHAKKKVMLLSAPNAERPNQRMPSTACAGTGVWLLGMIPQRRNISAPGAGLRYLEDKVMPIYDYKCDACGNVAEFLLGNFKDSPAACPQCGGTDMERLLSASYMIKMGAPSSCGTCMEPSQSCQSSGCPSSGCCAQS